MTPTSSTDTFVQSPVPFPVTPYRLSIAPPPYASPAPPYDHYDSRSHSRHRLSYPTATNTRAEHHPRVEHHVHHTRRQSTASAATSRRSDRPQSIASICPYASVFSFPVAHHPSAVRGSKPDKASGLHPILAMKPAPPILFDVRFPDSKMQLSRQWAQHRFDPATREHATFLRVYVSELPWTFDMSGVAGNPVTVADVFHALYIGLNVPLTDVEWALADNCRRKVIMKASQRRVQGSGGNLDVRRVDWLGKKTLFRSMERSTARSDQRWLSTDSHGIDVWEVRFGSQS